MSNDQPSAIDHGAQIPFLIRKRRFADCMILAWQHTEDFVGQMVLQELGLRPDPRAELQINHKRYPRFKSKLQFLEDRERISDNDKGLILDFYNERNKLFHGAVFKPRVIDISEEEKTRLMELASKSSQIVTNRAFGVWYDEGTGDTGNLKKPKKRLTNGR